MSKKMKHLIVVREAETGLNIGIKDLNTGITYSNEVIHDKVKKNHGDTWNGYSAVNDNGTLFIRSTKDNPNKLG